MDSLGSTGYFELSNSVAQSVLMNFLFYSTAAIVLLPFLVGLVRLRYLILSQKILLLVVLWGSLIQGVTLILLQRDINNLAVNHLYHFFDFALLSLLFLRVLPKKKEKLAVTVMSTLVLVFSVINSALIQKLDGFDSYAATLGSAVLIAYSLYYFFILLKNPISSDLGSNPVFWIAAAVLVYHSGSLIIMFSSNYLLPTSQDIQVAVWSIHAVFNIIRYLIYAIALWVQPKKSPYSIS